MKEVRYMISDAAKKINVEPHVLRYWEEELGTEIPRNEMGHRYYREEDIRMMQGVKYLKEKGFQLKSIKILLPEVDKTMQLPQRRLLELRDRLELAVSREELRLQREEELKNYSGQEQKNGSAMAGDAVFMEQDEAGEKTGKNNMDTDADGRESREKAESMKYVWPTDHVPDTQNPDSPDGNETQIREQQSGKSSYMQTESKPNKKSFTLTAGKELKAKAAAWHSDKPEDGILPEKMPQKSELQENEPEGTPVPVSDNAERMRQFRRIMNEIIMDVMRENNKELTENITASVSKEMEYHMRKREMMQEEHFKQLDRTLREYQMGQKQAAVAKECGGRRESKFFKKNGKVRI
ncbi:MAG: helix-turn-helix domain-containing protein [Lachnospiraceae bacterium]|nr:helix-turn-helix domain-containing protein [Lachnospiraceae bacterium]